MPYKSKISQLFIVWPNDEQCSTFINTYNLATILLIKNKNR